MKRWLLCFLVTIMLFSCMQQNPSSIKKVQPNILWIVAEDLSSVIPSFGDSTVVTPHISRLANEGVCYDKVFSPSGVCAPSRAAIATGMYPIHIGANHMRTGPWFRSDLPPQFIDNYAKGAMPTGIVPYEAIPQPEVKMMSEYLRKAGYYCTNNAKEDYQFRKSLMAWDECSSNAHWRNREDGQPFFSIFNIEVTHESRIWAKANDSLWVDEHLNVPIPPYLPTTDSAMMDVRRMYSNIKEMDNRVGEILSELEEDGLLDNTIIFWYTDHGGPLPRQKRLNYDSGLRVPMIIRFPNKEHAGTRDGQLVSFIDFAPTIMSLANIEPPEYLDGKAFLGKHKETTKRDYIHAAADRFDESYHDPIRAVRDDRYKLIRYYDTLKPMFYPVAYREQMPIMRELHRLRKEDRLTKEQALWFRESKPLIELFDTYSDPHELNNLAFSPEHMIIQERLVVELDRWLTSMEDLNMSSEEELVSSIWPDNTQPITATPDMTKLNSGALQIESATKGASIGYKVISNGDTTKSWQVYVEPLEVKDGQHVLTIAHRLGYKPSETTIY